MIIFCYLKASIDYFRYGVFIPHTYEEVSRETHIVIAGQNSFRVSNDFRHLPGECVHRNATVITSACKYCGKLEYSWFDGDEEDIPVI